MGMEKSISNQDAPHSTAATTAEKKRPQRNEKGWQVEKSAMTRWSILEATIQCLLELGYANTTTALIANYAGVSRGAMMHHFPSRFFSMCMMFGSYRIGADKGFVCFLTSSMFLTFFLFLSWMPKFGAVGKCFFGQQKAPCGHPRRHTDGF